MPSTHHGLLVHVIFSTKGRYPLIADAWQAELFAYIGGILREHEAILLAAGGVEDHVHLLVKIHPRYAISSTVQLLKQNSSRWINENRFVDCKFQWQRGFGAFSVSQSMVDRVKSYIDSQRDHHASQSFEDEYLSTLRKHRIEFDERYVFDKEYVG